MCIFKKGDNVKVNSFVYEYKWDGWENIYKTFRHHNMIVSDVIDMTDVVDGEMSVIVEFNNKKYKFRPDYLDNLTRF